jgi:hypothetical protein
MADGARDNPPYVSLRLTRPAAEFLLAAVRYLNTLKALPEANADAESRAQAVQTSTWLEEIEAAAKTGLRRPCDCSASRYERHHADCATRSNLPWPDLQTETTARADGAWQ